MVKYWIMLLILITCFCGLLYGSIQQVLRMDANDPQIQMAEDTATHLNNGLPPQAAVGQNILEISKSLSPFVIIYNTTGQPMASSAKLNGQIPWLPAGVFQSVKQNGEDRFTWEPQTGTRLATVIVPYENGYVVAGRSLREVENRENDLFIEVSIAWLVSLIVTTLPFAITYMQTNKQKLNKSKKRKK